MVAKQQVSLKLDPEVIKDFDQALLDFKEATGVKPVKQESIEMAMKDYIQKLRHQIDVLSKNK